MLSDFMKEIPLGHSTRRRMLFARPNSAHTHAQKHTKHTLAPSSGPLTGSQK